MNAPETMPGLLIRLRRQSDRDAWTTLSTLYQPLIYEYCRKRGLQDADSADVVQEVLVAVARAMPKFRYNRSQGMFRSWILSIAKNKLINLINRQKREVQSVDAQLVDTLAISEGSNRLEREEQARYRQSLFDAAAEQVRAEFRETTWKAFWLTAVQGLSIREVSECLGISVRAVYIARSRVVRRLREVIQHSPTSYRN